MTTSAALHRTSDALTLVEAALGAVDHAQRSALSPDELVSLMTRARRLRDRLDGLACVLTDEVRRREAAMAARGTPITSLLALTENLDAKDAAGQVFEAAAVASRPLVREAALSGDVSTRHAAAISRTLDALPNELSPEQQEAAEVFLLSRAQTLTPRQVGKLGGEVLAEVAPELAPKAGDQAKAIELQYRRAREKRTFTYGDDGDGSTWFRGSLPSIDAAPLIKIVESYVEADRRQERETGKTLRSIGAHHRLIKEHSRVMLGRTMAQRSADALVSLVADHRGAPTVAGDRPRIVVTMTEESLRQRVELAGLLDAGASVPAGELRRMCCDADLLPVVLGGDSELLDVGRVQRLVTPGIRRALSLRDGGCVFPNCDVTDARCEAHHIKPWAVGGRTELSNLVLLCRHHHKLVEPDPDRPQKDLWRIRIDPRTQKPEVTPPRRLALSREAPLGLVNVAGGG